MLELGGEGFEAGVTNELHGSIVVREAEEQKSNDRHFWL